MGCIDWCEVPAAVTGGGEVEEQRREGRQGGIWRSADYAEQSKLLAGRVRAKKQSQEEGKMNIVTEASGKYCSGSESGKI